MDTAALFSIGGGAATLFVAGAAGVRAIAKPLRRLAKQNDLFRDEWWGKPAEPLLNRPRTPSVPERLAHIESELKPNHGSSMRDAIDRVERHLADHVNDTNAHPRSRS